MNTFSNRIPGHLKLSLKFNQIYI